MLYLHPELVRMERARDFELTPKAFKRYMRGQLPVPPPGGAGVVGRPTLATTAKGEAIYRRIIGAVRTAVFLEPVTAETDTV
jgi:creatinine amidohydrolase/Fe(II)-dependent formamide hydrolase-like protein